MIAADKIAYAKFRREMIKNAREVIQLVKAGDMYGAKTPINRLYKLKIALNARD